MTASNKFFIKQELIQAKLFKAKVSVSLNTSQIRTLSNQRKNLLLISLKGDKYLIKLKI
jgi:hypothetical protein